MKTRDVTTKQERYRGDDRPGENRMKEEIN